MKSASRIPLVRTVESCVEFNPWYLVSCDHWMELHHKVECTEWHLSSIRHIFHYNIRKIPPVRCSICFRKSHLSFSSHRKIHCIQNRLFLYLNCRYPLARCFQVLNLDELRTSHGNTLQRSVIISLFYMHLPHWIFFVLLTFRITHRHLPIPWYNRNFLHPSTFHTLGLCWDGLTRTKP